MPKISLNHKTGEVVTQPIVSFLVGQYGAVDPRIVTDFADEFGALYIDPFQIRQVAFQALRDKKERNQHRILGKRIRNLFYEEASIALQNGLDVVTTQTFNTETSRAELAIFAKKFGAVPVGVTVHTPLSVAQKRVEMWDESGTIPVDPEAWSGGSFLHHASRVLTVVPIGHMEPVIAIETNGLAPVDDLLDDLHDSFDAHAIQPASR